MRLAMIGYSRSEGGVSRIRRDGTGLKRLTGGPYTWTESPSWSPNGRWIVFSNFYTQTEDFDDNLRRVRPNGRDNRPVLVDSDHSDAWPDWGVLPE